MDGRDERRAGEKNSAGGQWLFFKRERQGGGPRGVGAAWRRSGRERGGPGHDVEQRGGVASAQQRPGCSACRRRVVVRQWRAVGSTSLTGGPGCDRGGPVISG
jgi:hypothetical protein